MEHYVKNAEKRTCGNPVENKMKERPILFSGEMVRAILEGRKTQTRRVITKVPELAVDVTHNNAKDIWFWVGKYGHLEGEIINRYGIPGDRLWVRETWADMTACYEEPLKGESPLYVAFKADDSVWNVFGKAVYIEQLGQGGLHVEKWKPSIHMHWQSSRITLEITNVRVERLQRISHDDACDEGIGNTRGGKFACIERYGMIWDKINGKKHPWSSNPWVWVISFKKL